MNKQIPSQIKAILGDDFNLKSYFETKAESSPPTFEPDILPNTFSYIVDGKTCLTNAFVKAKCQTDNESMITITESEYSDSEISICENLES